MMDISKILDFHRMVMLMASQPSDQDETSCGPLCQHPACWESRRRQERGVPHVKSPDSGMEEKETDLPTMSYYNMLEEYGESSEDRFPTRYGGRPQHERSSSMKSRSRPLRSNSCRRKRVPATAAVSLVDTSPSFPATPQPSCCRRKRVPATPAVSLADTSPSFPATPQPSCIDMTTARYTTPVSPDKAFGGSASSMQSSGMKVVEVQEVFDQSDLNSRWDETFITKRFLVWVPNPNRPTLTTSKDKPVLAITEKGEEEGRGPKTLQPKDLTESMVPLHIQQEREYSVLFDDWPVLKKRQDRSRSPIFQKGTYPKTPLCGIKPDVDSEGVRELLSLPRDVLVQVLDRTKDSDFVSREKIHSIIQDVLDTMRDGRDLSMPQTGTLHTGDILLQQKALLHYNKHRNMRDLPAGLPQLDEDRKGVSFGKRGVGGGSSVGDSARIIDPAGSAQHQGKALPRYVVCDDFREFTKNKKPLPAISGDEVVRSQKGFRARGTGRSRDRQKIPAVSLGLPELPSGLRHTRAFVYNSKHRPDFSLVPVPTPPQSVRSSGSMGSDHGTTMRVHNASLSTNCHNVDFTFQPQHTHKAMEDDGMMQEVSPTLSNDISPKAPASTPAAFHSPTKMFHEFTATSMVAGGGGGDGACAPPPSSKIAVSSVHKIRVPGVPFSTDSDRSASPGELGLSIMKEPGREHAGPSPLQSSHHTRTTAPSRVQFPHNTYGWGQVTFPEEWPQVTEPTMDGAVGIMASRSDTAFITEPIMEYGAHHRALNSRGSDRSPVNTSLARRILDEGGKVEYPAPPPPSPEPGEKAGALQRGNKQVDTKSREVTTAMAPLLEQNESEGSGNPEKRRQGGKDGISKAKPSTTQGPILQPVIQEEVGPSKRPTILEQPATSANNLDPVSKVMVSLVAPQSSASQAPASREKPQQTFMNVDIPAEDLSSLHAEPGSTPFDDLTLSASPGKTPSIKLSATKSPARPGSLTRKTPPGTAKKGKGSKRNGAKGSRDSGEGRPKSEPI